MRNQKKPLHIAIVGGGKGTSRIIAGLKHYPVVISAIISTADNGSSSGRLREEFAMVPPGDMRQCLVALAGNNPLARYSPVRFSRGNFYGHPLGNIVLALLYDHHKDIQKAVDETCALLGIQGHEVLPTTLVPTTLIATLADKTTLRGESTIVRSKNLQKKNAHFSLAPRNCAANPRACKALLNADAIIVGPGNLFASILPALLVRDIQRALLASKAKKIFVANIMTQKGHTENFSPGDFACTIESYAPGMHFNTVFYNITPIPESFWNKNIGFRPVRARKEEMADPRFIPGKFMKPIKEPMGNDPIASMRSLVLHDENTIAKKIIASLYDGKTISSRKK